MTTPRPSLRGRLAAIWADMTHAHAAIGRITPIEQAATPISQANR